MKDSITLEQIHGSLSKPPLKNISSKVVQEYATIDEDMYSKYRELIYISRTAGRLTGDAAEFILRKLGNEYSEENGGWKSDVDITTKVRLTQLIYELRVMQLEGTL